MFAAKQSERGARTTRAEPTRAAPAPPTPLPRLRDVAGPSDLQGYLTVRLGSGPRRPVQASRAIGPVDDPLEREADRAAEQVLADVPFAGAAPRLQRLAEPAAAPAAEAPPSVERTLAKPGTPLDPALRRRMEARFGHDFAGVRVHADASAADSAREIGARAYTAGEDIVFGPGAYAPGTEAGQRLLAHELAHVVQQAGAPGRAVQRAPEASPLARFWSGVAAVQVTERAQALVNEAIARMLREQGAKLAELEKQIAILRRPYWQEDLDGQTRRLAARQALEDQRQEIIAAYDPSVQRSSAAPFVPPPYIHLPVETMMAPLYGPPRPFFPASAPDIAPEFGPRLGRFGGQHYEHAAVRSSVADAYAYDIETDAVQVANDLERLGRAGYTEIHIATGTHGTPEGTLDPEYRFLREDARSIHETTQRHPGLRIIPYNMNDPVQAAQFRAMQALAAEGRLPGGATIAAHCFSRTCVPDPNEGFADPIGQVEVLARDPLAYLHGSLAVGAGALSIYSGLEDPNRTIGALKVAGGGAQALGGAGYMAGQALDSIPLARFGGRLAMAGGLVTAPLGFVDFYRDMQRKFAGGPATMGGEEAVFHGVNDALKLAGTIFPQAALAAITVNFAVMPAAQAASERLTPMFIGGISEAYGIPTQYLWGMH